MRLYILMHCLEYRFDGFFFVFTITYKEKHEEVGLLL